MKKIVVYNYQAINVSNSSIIFVCIVEWSLFFQYTLLMYHTYAHKGPFLLGFIMNQRAGMIMV